VGASRMPSLCCGPCVTPRGAAQVRDALPIEPDRDAHAGLRPRAVLHGRLHQDGAAVECRLHRSAPRAPRAALRRDRARRDHRGAAAVPAVQPAIAGAPRAARGRRLPAPALPGAHALPLSVGEPRAGAPLPLRYTYRIPHCSPPSPCRIPYCSPPLVVSPTVAPDPAGSPPRFFCPCRRQPACNRSAGARAGRETLSAAGPRSICGEGEGELRSEGRGELRSKKRPGRSARSAGPGRRGTDGGRWDGSLRGGCACSG